MPEYGLAVSLAGVRKYDPKHPGAASLAINHHGRTQAEVYLCFLARQALHALNALGVADRQAPHVAFHAVVSTGKVVIDPQVLEDPLRRQSGLNALQHHLVVRSAEAWTPRDPGGRNGWF